MFNVTRTVLILSVPCAAASNATAQRTTSRAARVYLAVLEASRGRAVPDTLVLRDSSARFQMPVGAIPSWRQQFDSLPRELAIELDRVSSTRVASQELSLPRPIHVLTRALRDSLFGPADLNVGWASFHRRFPSQGQILAFSPVVFSGNGNQAMVFAESQCGGRCGRGELVWLVRDQNKDEWQVRKAILLWIS